MLRLLVIIVLAIVGTAVGIWSGLSFSQTMLAVHEVGSGAKAPKKREFLVPELFVVPVLTDNSLAGYFVCRLVFIVDPHFPPIAGIPETAMLADFFSSAFYDDHTIVQGVTITPDMSKMLEKLLANLNIATGGDRYIGALIQQIDYFKRDEVRRKVVESRFSERNPS